MASLVIKVRNNKKDGQQLEALLAVLSILLRGVGAAGPSTKQTHRLSQPSKTWSTSCAWLRRPRRSPGVRPVRLAMRASIPGPISSPSWKAHTTSLFDAYYLIGPVLKFLKRVSWQWVSRIKGNRRLKRGMDIFRPQVGLRWHDPGRRRASLEA